jgi:type I restriction enzyme R subunit
MGVAESTVESAALSWLELLGYATIHGGVIAPGEPSAERKSYGDVVLVRRLRDAITRINPGIPSSALEDAVRKITPGFPSLVGSRTFHGCLSIVPVSTRP